MHGLFGPINGFGACQFGSMHITVKNNTIIIEGRGRLLHTLDLDNFVGKPNN